MIKLKVSVFSKHGEYMNYFLLVFLFLLSFNGFSFDGSKCNEELFQRARKQTPEAGLLSTTVAVPVSTSQFISSTGSCSAIAIAEYQKKEFLANNYEPLKIDLARGGGEFAFTYAELSGCSGGARKKYSGYLQKNFLRIYGVKLENSIEEIYNHMVQVILENKNLVELCSARKIM